MFVPSEEFQRLLVSRFGEDGENWLADLPQTLEELSERWDLTLGDPFAGGMIGFTSAATLEDGTPVVLKTGFPDEEFMDEAEALRRFDGRGAVRLLDEDLDAGALLLERLVPGTPLLDVDEEQGNAVAAQVLTELWRTLESDHPFDTTDEMADEWSSSLPDQFDALGTPLDRMLLDEALDLLEGLTSASGDPALLHGDLHHGNILAATREPWLSIDPKGFAGDREYDTAKLLRDRLEALLADADPERRAQQRFDQLAEQLGLDRARMRAWAIVDLIACAIEDFEGGRPELGELRAAGAGLLSELRA